MGSHFLSHSSAVRKKKQKNKQTKNKNGFSGRKKHDEKRRVGVRARELCEQAGGLGLSLFHSLSHCSPAPYSFCGRKAYERRRVGVRAWEL